MILIIVSCYFKVYLIIIIWYIFIVIITSVEMTINTNLFVTIIQKVVQRVLFVPIHINVSDFVVLFI